MTEPNPPAEDPAADARMRERLCAALDASTESISAEQRTRLASARRRAMRQARTRPRSLWPALVPAGALVAGALGLIVNGAERSVPAGPGSLIEDIEVLSSKPTLDLYEHLDFYEWLGTDDRAG